MEESACVRLARDGDRAAFRSLFESHRQRVFSLAYRYLRNRPDAEDVVQETFIKAFHSLPRYSPEKGPNFASWLHRICINASIDTLRKNQRTNARSLAAEDANELPVERQAFNPVAASEGSEIRARINQALRNLSPKQQIIFSLRHYEEYSIREIAAQLGSTEGSVKKHLFRAVRTSRNPSSGSTSDVVPLARGSSA
jgi:RNA polymerase sigma-70 factor (ECF subfamily)